ncbi:MAG: hypothetical protein Q8O26_05230 [Phreatobacter sp.]|uniref:hypothetical protein n=1 Tax=Phreatobacter sp. TaxID=1966341 RepID=UPI0027331585|nr:hypothetical protein [Phreatobacter sp.]MDP2801268.1 hypothetical protein [Phreatobacter sp.]
MTTTAPSSPRTFSRLAVPTSASAAVTSGTYFRLGGYIDAEESGLIPANLTYSSSVTTQELQTLPDTTNRETAAEEYNTTLNSRNQDLFSQEDGSSLATSSGGRTRNTTRQFELNKISITRTAQTPLKNGILAKTDGDIIAVADGGAIVDLEKGLMLASQTGDFTVDLPAGAAKFSTFNGIEMQAGNSTHPANIALTAFGYIKQAAYGPLDDVRFATSSMKTYGYTKEWFYGEKYSEHHGTSTSKFYGDETRVTDGTSDQTFLGFANAKFVGRRHTFNLAGTLTIALAGDFTLHAGGKLDINIGLYMKINAIGEAKVCGVIDFKLAHIDFKIVDIDCKFINGAEIKQEKLTLKQTVGKIWDKSLDITGSRIKAAGESIAAKFTSADVTA